MKIIPNEQNLIELLNYEEENLTLPVNQFNNEFKLDKITIVRGNKGYYISLILGCFLVIGGLFIIRLTYNWYYKGRSYYNIVTKE